MPTLTDTERTDLEQAAFRGVAAGIGSTKHTYRGRGATVDASCDVRIFTINQGGTPADMAVVVLSDRADNPGRSVTNAIEQVAAEVYAEHLEKTIPHGRVAWIQHNPLGRSAGPAWERVELQAQIEADTTTFHGPQWSRLQAQADSTPSTVAPNGTTRC